jgi:cell division protein FtsW
MKKSRLIPDVPLMVWAILASLFGLLFIFDAGYPRSIKLAGSPVPTEFTMQVVAILACGVAYAIVQLLPADWYQKMALPAWLLTLVSLIAVDFVGTSQNEAKRWLPLGPVQVQPSEFAKLTLILFLAAVFVNRKPWEPTKRKRSFALWIDNVFAPQVRRWVPGILAVLGAMLVELGKDLGTAGVLFAIFGLMCVVGGISRRSWIVLGAIVFVLVPALFMKQSYRMERLTTHAQRWSAQHVDDAGFQTTQAERAMADGGLLGVQIGKGQVKHIIPATTTDFILATVAEEIGLIGVLALLGVLAALVARLIQLARRQQDPFRAYVMYGFASWIAVQTCVNVMMANATLPAIGIPIPFVSSGGSSLAALWLGMAIVQRFVAEQARVEQEEAVAISNHRGWNRRPHLSGA